MDIIDAHLHFYDLGNKINGWIYRQTDTPFLHKNCLPDMLSDKANHRVYAAIHIEAHDSSVPTTVEIEWLAKAMEDVKNLKYRHIALADVTLPHAEFRDVIAQVSKYDCVAGIRHIFSFNPSFKYSPCDSDLSNHPNIEANLKCLKDYNLIFDCQGYPYQINNLLPTIKESGVTCVLDHFSLPAWNKDNDADHKLWQQTIIKLTDEKKIFIKASGLDMFKNQDDFDGVIDFCVNNFPSERLIYGSNHPLSFKGDYNAWYDYLYNYIDKNSWPLGWKQKLFHQNAYDLFFKEY